MGHRANLLVVTGGRPALFYSHWRAITLDVDLFWGPGPATAFVRSQQPADSSGWLDDVWAEGGAVIDHDRQVLLFFGGEDVMSDVPLRRLHLALMRRVWVGWDVRWASRGIVDIAEHVGVSAATVLSDRVGLQEDGEPDEPPSLEPPEDPSWVTGAGSVRSADGQMRLFPTDADVTSLLIAGRDRLLAAAAGTAGQPFVRWADWASDFPQGGFHLDECDQTLDFWMADPAAQAADRVTRQWPGWAVRFHGDQYERHAALASGSLEFPGPNAPVLAEVIRRRLLRPAGQSGVDLMTGLMARLKAETGEVGTANPHALRDAQLDLPVERKAQILAAALAGVDRGVTPHP